MDNKKCTVTHGSVAVSRVLKDIIANNVFLFTVETSTKYPTPLTWTTNNLRVKHSAATPVSQTNNLSATVITFPIDVSAGWEIVAVSTNRYSLEVWVVKSQFLEDTSELVWPLERSR